jgi:hypothetical protein
LAAVQGRDKLRARQRASWSRKALYPDGQPHGKTLEQAIGCWTVTGKNCGSEEMEGCFANAVKVATNITLPGVAPISAIEEPKTETLPPATASKSDVRVSATAKASSALAAMHERAFVALTAARQLAVPTTRQRPSCWRSTVREHDGAGGPPSHLRQ